MRLHPTELRQPMLTRYLSPIFGVVLLTIVAPMSIAADRPNIAIILADDLGYGSLNSYGADETHIRTANIDRLAQSGRRFTDANTPSSVCSPTRYGLLTGRDDPGEQNNLLDERPDVVNRLASLLEEQRNSGRSR